MFHNMQHQDWKALTPCSSLSLRAVYPFTASNQVDLIMRQYGCKSEFLNFNQQPWQGGMFQ
jgi:hypothetical protein